MAERVRISGGNIGNYNNEARDAQVDVNGNLHTREGVVDADNYVYEDSAFVSGSSPATLNVQSDLGRKGVDGYIVCDGSGSILVDVSRDGVTYPSGGQFTIKASEVFSLLRLNVSKIRITHSGTDSAYRVFVI
jgi:hypothetical protein